MLLQRKVLDPPATSRIPRREIELAVKLVKAQARIEELEAGISKALEVYGASPLNGHYRAEGMAMVLMPLKKSI